jgi:hypothetical protein
MNLTGLRELIPVVTTAATMLGAIAATVAAIFSALAHRHQLAKRRTVIEAQPLWHPRGLPVLPISVRNQLVRQLAWRHHRRWRGVGARGDLSAERGSRRYVRCPRCSRQPIATRM